MCTAGVSEYLSDSCSLEGQTMFRSGAILVAVLAALAATPNRAAIAAPFIDGTFAVSQSWPRSGPPAA
jgi:hypothetical protein